jgi:hypothetical protein
MTIFAAAALSSASAQAPPGTPQQQIAAALNEVKAQQTQIAANQAQIDAKLAALAEAIRLARIYAGRGGK